MEDKLPKKWFIIRNKKNHKVLNEYNNKKYNANNANNAYFDDAATMFSDKSFCGGNCSNKAILDGYQEITFEQFEKYVLNKQPESVINNNYEIF